MENHHQYSYISVEYAFAIIKLIMRIALVRMRRGRSDVEKFCRPRVE